MTVPTVGLKYGILLSGMRKLRHNVVFVLTTTSFVSPVLDAAIELLNSRICKCTNTISTKRSLGELERGHFLVSSKDHLPHPPRERVLYFFTHPYMHLTDFCYDLLVPILWQLTTIMKSEGHAFYQKLALCAYLKYRFQYSDLTST